MHIRLNESDWRISKGKHSHREIHMIVISTTKIKCQVLASIPVVLLGTGKLQFRPRHFYQPVQYFSCFLTTYTCFLTLQANLKLPYVRKYR
jgi:hypothetical protein